jgi:hypothetical protein
MIREDTLFFESERCGMAIAAIVGVLWGSTLFFYFVDRAWRKRPPRVGDDKIRLPGTEPSVWLMLLLTLSCTFTALPYYFYNTRGPFGFVAGIVLFLASVGLAYGAWYAMLHYPVPGLTSPSFPALPKW